MENPEFDPLKAEAQELDLLIGQGMGLRIPKRSMLKYFSKKKERRFVIHQPFLGTLDYLSKEYIQMGFDEQALTADPMGESKRLVFRNARRCARIVAISILNNRLQIGLLLPFLSRYLLWHLTPDTLFQLTVQINRISNIADFTASIRFLSITKRTTEPALIERQKPDQKG